MAESPAQPAESRWRRINRLKRQGRQRYGSLLLSVGVLFVGMAGSVLYVHGDLTSSVGEMRAAKAVRAEEQRRLTAATDAPTPSPTCTFKPTNFYNGHDKKYSEGFFWEDPLVSEPYVHAGRNGQSSMIFLHILGVCWMFIALMLVCDCFFCPALTEMVEKWQIKEDVAGATFMAAGGSAPELFTSIIGVFFAESDVGFGTIVGSAVFNVLFVIGLCAIASGADMPLTWWPLFRDCTYYIIGLLVLAIFVFDSEVEGWEAVVLFLLYCGYVTIMYFNEKLEAKVKSMVSKGGTAQIAPGAGQQVQVADADNKYAQEAADKLSAAPAEADAGAGGGTVAMDPEAAAPEESKAEGEDKKEEEEEDEDPWAWPDNFGERVLFVAAFPLKVGLYGTLADCSKEEKKGWFLQTFFGSLIWIALYSYFMVWWATIIGDVVGIPPVVMGLTFLAAGTSIPDALSSVYMAKMGEGDMAISSSIGSNVFDILVGLPIPWMLKIFCTSTEFIYVNSPFVVVHVLVLLFMVIMVVASIAYLGWKLDMRLGGIMGGLYVVFLVIALWLELAEPSEMALGKDLDDGC